MPVNKIPGFITDDVTLTWACLEKPDVHFGPESANHNVTFVLDGELAKKIASILKSSGGKKVNGKYEKDGVVMLKVKSKQHIDKVRFPTFAADATPSEVPLFGGDVVRLKLQPILIARDNTLSFYLNGVQLVTKNSKGYTGGFTPIETTTTSEDELPF